MNLKFLKGIGLMIAVILAALKTPPVIWTMTISIAVLTGISYYVKNYFISSNSRAGIFNLRDFISGVILLICATLIDSVGQYIVNGRIDFNALWPIVRNVAGTYFVTTLFSPQKQNS